ncbi:MAG: SHOCT domain-containing protein, partial [Planctomycetota bacterium]
MGIAEEIEKLNNLKQTGAISDDEYQEAKTSLLKKNQSAGEKFDRAVGQVSSDV